MALGLGKVPNDALVFPDIESDPQAPDAFSAEWRDVADAIGLDGVPSTACGTPTRVN